jgi:hypothetical protein
MRGAHFRGQLEVRAQISCGVYLNAPSAGCWIHSLGPNRVGDKAGVRKSALIVVPIGRFTLRAKPSRPFVISGLLRPSKGRWVDLEETALLSAALPRLCFAALIFDLLQHGVHVRRRIIANDATG